METKNFKAGIITIKDYNILSEENSKLIFQAASISKTLTSFLVMKLVQEGVLDLNKNVNFYLSDWKVVNKKNKNVNVNLKSLLSHTAGISCEGFRGYEQNKKIPRLIEILKGRKPANNEKIYCKYKRGNYRYSGGGYMVIQKIIEDVTGKKFEILIRNKIFKPLKMNNSFFDKPKKFINGYEKNRQVNKGFFLYPEKAAAGLWTNAEDLCKFLIEIQLSYLGKSNKILSKSSTRQMLKPIISAERNFMSLGFFISKDKKNFYHSGYNVGYRSKFIFDFKGNGIVVLTNEDEERFIREILKREWFS